MKKKFKKRKTPFVILIFFLILWMFGVGIGEPNRVIEQAKSICLECIGIG